MKAFDINIGGKIFDYRLGKRLDQKEVEIFFQKKGYFIEKYLSYPRHLCALISKNDNVMFMKLSTSKGISAVTENEAAWNDYMKIQAHPTGVLVPKIHDRGYYNNLFFYMITDYLDGPHPTASVVLANTDRIIDLTEKIMSLKLTPLPADSYHQGKNHLEKFLNKTKAHFGSVPNEIKNTYKLKNLLRLIEANVQNLSCRPRHGDFSPWHLIFDKNNRLCLIDGEHAMSQGVEYYDIAYFIQRAFSVWKKPEIAKKIYGELTKRSYDTKKLKTVLAARAIGGFLDESLAPNPDYEMHEEFMKWIVSI